MSFPEFGFYLLQQSAHFVFGECHDPRADFLCASLIRRIKRANENPRRVRAQRDGGAMNRNGGHELEMLFRGLIKDGDRVLHDLHFREREQKGQRGFRALVAVYAIHVQRVAAAPRA